MCVRVLVCWMSLEDVKNVQIIIIMIIIKIIKFYQQVGKECTKTGQQADAKEANNFGEKYGNGEIITEKPNR